MTMYGSRLRILSASFVLVVALLAGWLSPAGSGSVPHSLATGVFTQHTFQDATYLLYVPPNLPADRPVTALVAIHGVGAQPESFATGLVDTADRYGWVLVVPHLPYGDCLQPDVVKAEEKKFMAWLDGLIPVLPDETSLQLREQVLIYGFSRGGQLAHRFALAYPSRVVAAAIMSPGSYTLPMESSAAFDNHAPLTFPVGVSDIGNYCGRSFDVEAVKKIPFWIGVGDKDTAPSDVPRLWDKYLGTTRLERARKFASLLSGVGAQVQLNVFPGLGHAESAETRGSAMAFLRASELAALGIHEQSYQPSVPSAIQPTDGSDQVPVTAGGFFVPMPDR
jgi:dienelactone hydrolase